MSAVLPMPAAAPPRRTLLLGLHGWMGVTAALAVVAIVVPVADEPVRPLRLILPLSP